MDTSTDLSNLSVASGDSSPERGASEKRHTAATVPLRGEPVKSVPLLRQFPSAVRSWRARVEPCPRPVVWVVLFRQIDEFFTIMPKIS